MFTGWRQQKTGRFHQAPKIKNDSGSTVASISAANLAHVAPAIGQLPQRGTQFATGHVDHYPGRISKSENLVLTGIVKIEYDSGADAVATNSYALYAAASCRRSQDPQRANCPHQYTHGLRRESPCTPEPGPFIPQKAIMEK